MRVAIKRVLSAACEQVNGENTGRGWATQEVDSSKAVFWPALEMRLTGLGSCRLSQT